MNEEKTIFYNEFSKLIGSVLFQADYASEHLPEMAEIFKDPCILFLFVITQKYFISGNPKEKIKNFYLEIIERVFSSEIKKVDPQFFSNLKNSNENLKEFKKNKKKMDNFFDEN